MTKELEALERLRNKNCEYLSLSMNREVCEDFKIIENTLKENQVIIEELERKNRNLILENRSLNQIDKTNELKLKALETIKEKKVDIPTLLDCHNAKEYNRWNGVRSHYSYPPLEIIQEEYDLLKEVLLCQH